MSEGPTKRKYKPHNWRRRKGNGYEFFFACESDRMRGELAPATEAEIDELARLFEQATESTLPTVTGP